MNKRIIISLSAIGLVAAIVIGGTWAYFSDAETSSGNTFSSGTMDFKIARPGDTGHAIFDVSNLRPGQVVEGYLAVVNDSTEGLDMKWKAWIPDFSDGTLDNVLEIKVTMNPSDFTEYTAFETAGYTIAGPSPDALLQDWTHIHNLVSGNTILAWNYKCCTLPDLSDCEDGVHEPFRVKWAGIYKIEVRMSETAGDDYQGKSFTGDIDFFATQCEAPLF